MNYRHYSLAAFALLASACGGSSTPNAVDASSVSSAAGTFNALEGLLSNVDSSSSSPKLSPRGLTGNQKYSRMACEYVNQRDRTFKQLRQVGNPLCHIKAVSEANTGFIVGEGEYTYYKITGNSGPNGVTGSGFNIRLKKTTGSDGKKELEYQMFQDGAQQEDFHIQEIDGGVSAFIVHHEKRLDRFKNAVVTHKSSLDVTALGATSDALTKATINAVFEDDWGCGSVNVKADKSLQRNSMLFFSKGSHNLFSHQTAACVYASRGEGSGHAKSSDTFPAFTPPNSTVSFCPSLSGPVTATGPTCTFNFDQSESFTFKNTTPPEFLVQDPGNAALVSLVSNCTLGTDCTAPSDFRVTWDGTAPAGKDFVTIDMGQIVASKACETNFKDNFDFVDCAQREFKENHPTGVPR